MGHTATQATASTHETAGTGDARGTRRGSLKVYLGFAPGVGKTYAMLQEGHELAAQGVDVLVGFVEDHGRARTRAQVEGLPVVPRLTVQHKGATFEDMDVADILRRAPRVALVDELAHTIVAAPATPADPGEDTEPHTKRWQDVYTLLDAGIDVISTVNIQHLESLNDVVAAVTGTRQRETVPDQVLRDADDVVLVDLTPDALRIRLSRGDIYDAVRAEAALANYFRLGNLTALRELSLLWLADKVEEGLDAYRQREDITEHWPTRERIVVAVDGGADSDMLIRRGARIAGRQAGRELIVVHIAVDDGLRYQAPQTLARLQQLTEELQGEWRIVLGSDVADTLIDFATSVNASQLLIGTAGIGRFSPSARTSRRIIDQAGKGIDVHIVSTAAEHTPRRPWRYLRRGMPLSRHRTLGGWAAATAGPPLLTAGVLALNPTPDFFAPILLGYLTLVVLIVMAAGLRPAIVAVLSGSLLANWFFTEPTHTFNMTDPENIVALLLFLVIAVAVSLVVDLAERRGRQARRAQQQAVVLTDLATGVLRGGDDMTGLLRRLRETFALGRVDLQRYAAERKKWFTVASSAGDGALVDAEPAAPGRARIPLSEELRLVVWDAGRELTPEDLTIMEAHGGRIATLLAREDIDAMRRATAALEAGNRVGTALLTAVSHDLRTPLAGIKAAVSSLTLDDVDLGEDTRRQLVAMIEQSTDRLDTVVGNLLDMSRVNSHAVTVSQTPLRVADVVDATVAELPEAAAHTTTDIPDDCPEVIGDAGLMQRVLANLLINARLYAPASPVHITATCTPGAEVALRISDHGPGVPPDKVEDLFVPFQRLGDHGNQGLGLGLAVAQGFVEAMGGSLGYEPTPGGGATFIITLPAAPADTQESTTHG
nr:ATP-binding protein [Corynebacterium sp. 13CS0277]